MGIFQKSVLNRYLTNLDRSLAKASYEIFKNRFCNTAQIVNIKASKEEQYQEGFFRDLFVDCLGYTINPNPDYNLTTEFKNLSDSRKADGAIIHNSLTIAVMELKGWDTQELKEATKQAFEYKYNHPSARYVVVSNFGILRLFVESSDEYEEFSIFNMQYQQFENLYLLLSRDSVFRDLPLKIKIDSKLKDRDVSEKLYSDYHRFKMNIFHNLLENNLASDKVELLKKSQKLLDRILFILFSEDRGLLEPNTIKRIIDENSDLSDKGRDEPLYETYKIYFNHIDKGSDKLRIPGYNGGLFAPDVLLDNLLIDDHVLKDDALLLSGYDFSTEVDVNILGHIFENSLNDIDELHAEVNGIEYDNTKSKRKRDGVFYTPKYITKYMIEVTLGVLCENKKRELGIKDVVLDLTKEFGRLNKREAGLLEALKSYRKYLESLKILDPAVGSGAFLNQALDYLIAEHDFIDRYRRPLDKDNLGFFDVVTSILENNLFGVDINEESVELARLSLWLRTAEKGRKLNDLSRNIKCGNSLVDDVGYAGKLAFDWNVEFSEVMASGGFDVVIGNPPYVRQELVKDFSSYFEGEYRAYSGKADLYVFFFEKAVRLLKPHGLLCFISSGKFVEASYGRPLLNYLVQETKLVEVIDFDDFEVFQGISAYPMISLFEKTQVSNYTFHFKYFDQVTVESVGFFLDHAPFQDIDVRDFIKNEYNFISKSVANLIDKVSVGSTTLTQMGLSPLVGVKTGYNDGYMTLQNESDFVKKYIFGKDIKRYSRPESYSKAIFPYIESGGTYQLISLTSSQPIYPELIGKKEKLSNRAIICDGIVTGSKTWYEYQQINKTLLFDREVIVYPNVSLGSNFTLSKDFVVDMTGFIIPTNDRVLLAILNSKLFEYLMSIYAISRRGGYLEYKTQYVEKLPIKIPSDSSVFVDLCEQMLALNSAIVTKRSEFIDWIITEFSLVSVSEKLHSFYHIRIEEFFVELKKKLPKNRSLNPKEVSDVKKFFEEYSASINDIYSNIMKIDQVLNSMIYELYGLSESEISVIEGKS